MVKTVAISADGKWLASGSQDNTVRIWDTATFSPYVRLQAGDLPERISFLIDERLLLITHIDSVTLEPWQNADLIQDLCSRVSRNLAPAEWTQYVGNEAFRQTYPSVRESVQSASGSLKRNGLGE
jgi:WD domain, G-beta repeat